jgi:hypothetical protein
LHARNSLLGKLVADVNEQKRKIELKIYYFEY